MSRDIYDALLSDQPIDGEVQAFLGALTRLARARRLAFAMADAEYQEGLWVQDVDEGEEEEEEEPGAANAPMMRLAAEERGRARFGLASPLAVRGVAGLKVDVQIDPTSDGGWLLTVTRVGPMEGEIAVTVRGADGSVEIDILPGEGAAQTWLDAIPEGELRVAAKVAGDPHG